MRPNSRNMYCKVSENIVAYLRIVSPRYLVRIYEAQRGFVPQNRTRSSIGQPREMTFEHPPFMNPKSLVLRAVAIWEPI